MNIYVSLLEQMGKYKMYYDKRDRFCSYHESVYSTTSNLPEELAHLNQVDIPSWGGTVLSKYKSALDFDALTHDTRMLSLDLYSNGHYDNISSLTEEALKAGVSFTVRLGEHVFVRNASQVSTITTHDQKIIAALIVMPSLSFDGMVPTYALYIAPGYANMLVDNADNVNNASIARIVDTCAHMSTHVSNANTARNVGIVGSVDTVGRGGVFALLNAEGGVEGAVCSVDDSLGLTSSHRASNADNAYNASNASTGAQCQHMSTHARNVDTCVHPGVNTAHNASNADTARNVGIAGMNAVATGATHSNTPGIPEASRDLGGVTPPRNPARYTRKFKVYDFKRFANLGNEDEQVEFLLAMSHITSGKPVAAEVLPFVARNNRMSSGLGAPILNRSFISRAIAASSLLHMMKYGASMAATSNNLIIAQGLKRQVTDNVTQEKVSSLTYENPSNAGQHDAKVLYASNSGTISLEKLSTPDISGLENAYNMELEASAASVGLAPSDLGLHKQQISADYIKESRLTFQANVREMKRHLERSIIAYIKLISHANEGLNWVEGYVDKLGVGFIEPIKDDDIGAFADAILKLKGEGAEIEQTYIDGKLGITILEKMRKKRARVRDEKVVNKTKEQ